MLKAAVSVSTSRLKPVVGTGWSKSRDAVISDSDFDSLSIGREIVRASQTLAKPASANEADRDEQHGASASCIGTRVDGAIESSA